MAYATGGTPSGITYGDFDGDGRTDIAISDSTDHGGKHNIVILPGTGGGAFGGAIAFQVGADATAAPTPTEGTVNLTSIAAGNLGSGGRRDLAFGGSGAGGTNGVGTVLDAELGRATSISSTPLTNIGTANLPQPSATFGGGNVTHVAIGDPLQHRRLRQQRPGCRFHSRRGARCLRANRGERLTTASSCAIP